MSLNNNKSHITFKLIDEQYVEILFRGKKVGRIVSPAGTTRNNLDAIQICGFDQAYSYWGCGVFSDIFNAKKDIQLLFNGLDNQGQSSKKILFEDLCTVCYNSKKNCKCINEAPFPFVLAKDYDEAKFNLLRDSL